MSSTSTSNTSPLPSSAEVNQLLQDLNQHGAVSPSRMPSIISITPSQLDTVVRLIRHQQAQTPDSTTALGLIPSGTQRLPDFHSLAKYEEIISKPLRPAYDGSPDGLIPFLNRLDIRRQDESWYPITFITIQNTRYDLIRQFTEIGESVILAETNLHWTSPTIQNDKFDINHPTYQARVLAKLLLASLTKEFCITVLHRIKTSYRNDGVMILWTICNNVHRSNIAFTETVKAKLRNMALANFDSIDKYLIATKDNLSLIISPDAADQTKHNDLLIYLFTQLRECTVAPFKQYIARLHVQYLEASLTDLTPMKLLQLAEDKIQILRHAQQWTQTDEPSIMALQAQLQRQKEDSDRTLQRLIAHVGRLAQQHIKRGPPDPYPPSTTPSPYPAWMIQPPNPGQHNQLVNNKLYTWCTKCRQGQDLWVCRHTTETHINGYTNSRNTCPRYSDRAHHLARPGIPTQSQAHGTISNTDIKQHHHIPVQLPPVTAQLSILD
jgi:hypothetical protein